MPNRMVFITRCLSGMLAYTNFKRCILRTALIGLLTVCASSALASTIQVNHSKLRLVDNVYQLNSTFTLTLSNFQHEALQEGVSLTFTIEFNLVHHRTWWFSDQIADVRQQRTLTYHALTRQYQLTINGLVSNYPDLSDALRALGSVRQWQVVDAVLLKKNIPYIAGVRMWLDTSQLPKPLQVNALTNNDWLLDSHWYHFNLSPGWKG